ncbi:MAG: hypothetical protein IPJ23_07825 [Ignavibacteriales bacterium]|nr:hypothetical protein [Ignavibacteriales bacterium]
MEFLASIHPKVVHFPIAFLLLYPIIELLFIISGKDFFSKLSVIFLTIGVIGSLFAVLSGNQAFELVKNWTNEGKEIFNNHQAYANLTVWFYSILLVIKYFLFVKKKLNRILIIVIFVMSLLGGYFVYQAGNYGGKLAEQVILNSSSPNIDNN